MTATLTPHRLDGEDPANVTSSKVIGHLTQRLSGGERITILDLGVVSQANLDFWAGEQGYVVKVYDFCREAAKGSLEAAVRELDPPDSSFDAVLVWDLVEYLTPELTQAFLGRVWRSLKPGGLVAAFFSQTRPPQPAVYYRSGPVAEIRPTNQFLLLGGDKIALVHGRFKMTARNLTNRDIQSAFQAFETIHSYMLRFRFTEFLFRRPPA